MKFLFDLGGVFFDWDPHYFYQDVIKDKEERDNFLNNICNDEWNIQQDAGRLIKDAESDLIKTSAPIWWHSSTTVNPKLLKSSL